MCETCLKLLWQWSPLKANRQISASMDRPIISWWQTKQLQKKYFLKTLLFAGWVCTEILWSEWMMKCECVWRTEQWLLTPFSLETSLQEHSTISLCSCCFAPEFYCSGSSDIIISPQDCQELWLSLWQAMVNTCVLFLRDCHWLFLCVRPNLASV